MWWYADRREDFEAERDDRILHRLYKARIPPLMLETKDIVEFK
jgi:hypothetical protein